MMVTIPAINFLHGITVTWKSEDPPNVIFKNLQDIDPRARLISTHEWGGGLGELVENYRQIHSLYHPCWCQFGCALQHTNDNYEMPLPLRNNRVTLSNNRVMEENRMTYLKKKKNVKDNWKLLGCGSSRWWMGSPLPPLKKKKAKSGWLITVPKHFGYLLQIINFFKTQILLSRWGCAITFWTGIESKVVIADV